jgi:hypothetical protein
MMVVVAGDDHNFPLGTERLGQRAQDRPGLGQRVTHRALAQLEHVAEQYEPVDPVRERLQQWRARLGLAQDIPPRAHPQVQV